MRDLFRHNLSAIGNRYPELAQRIRDHKPAPHYRRVRTSAGQFDLIRDTNGSREPWYGVPSPLEQARKYWAGKRLRNPGFMVFLGLDLGYQLFAYLENPNPNTHAYLLVERDLDAFHHLMHVADLEPIVKDPRTHLLVGVSEDRLFIELRGILQQRILYTLVKATQIEGGSASYRNHPAYYKRFLITLRDTIQDLLSLAGNAPHDSFIGVRHMLLNLETIAREPGIKDLFGKFRDRPAVIVATGPSLDKNHHLLTELQDQAVVISVDASFKFLLRNGVRPHFVACLERVPETVPFFNDLDPAECCDSVQVAVPVVVPEVYSVYPGPKALLYRTFAHFDWLENDKGTLPTGQSSANMAFKLAEALGCNPIILVGQDLAYADDGTTHSSAAYWGKTSDVIRPDRMQTFRVRGNTQDWVLTNRTWEGFRLHYTRDIAGYAGTVINATEGGAFIDGTEVMTLRQAIDNRANAPAPIGEQILRGLHRPTPEEAEACLQWIRATQIPRTVACLDEKIAEAQRFGRKARKTLENGAEVGELAGGVKQALTFYGELFNKGFFHMVAAHVVQPAFIQTMIEHNDIPNRLHHVTEINRARLQLHVKFFDDMIKILHKTKNVYLDPANTPP